MKSWALIFVFLLLAPRQKAFAWGEHGHHTICEVAAELVQNKDLKKFLTPRRHILGHLCNVPDIHWRSLGAESKSGDAGHFIEPNKLGVELKDLPLDLAKVFEKFPAHDPTFVITDIGSLWWRADQFYRMSVLAGKSAVTAPHPEGADWNNRDQPYNRAVYDMLVAMGLMGHFFGDASVPFHNDKDYDGFAVGHGGIHSFYESETVNVLGVGLPAEVLKVAQSSEKRTGKKTKVRETVRETDSALALIREVSLLSREEIKEILRLDKVLAPSTQSENGEKKQRHHDAKRSDAALTKEKFKPLILKEMARSALALAKAWDQSFREAGEPDLSVYRSFGYPLAPDFVPPDYIPKAKESAPK